MRNLGWPSVAVVAVLVLSCFLGHSVAQGGGSSVQLSPGDLAFGCQVVGSDSAAMTETLSATYQGTQGVTFGSISVSGKDAADFIVQSDTCSGANLTSGSCQIGIVFQPTAVGNRSAVVSVNDNVSGSPQIFKLQGKGTALKLTSLVIGPSNPSVVSGSQIQLTAQATYNDGTQKDVTNAAVWTSSDTNVATVNQGLATGRHAGKASIKAALQGVADRQELDVQYQVVFIQQPDTTPVSQEISPGVMVQVLDNGSPVANLTVAIDLGPNAPNPAVLSGKRKQDTGQDGTATFQHLKLDYLGDGYTLVATTHSPGGRSSTLSVPFSETRVGDPCLGPELPSCSSSCVDSDGDGLNDAWENAGGIDMNGDGLIDETHDLMLPGSRADKPDIYVWYDYMDYGLPGNACTQDGDCTRLGAGHVGETCIAPGNACAMACSADSDCTSRDPQGAHMAERCISNMCQHTHDPLALEANAFQPVVDRFAAHGISLHMLRGHAQLHSHVVSYRQLGQIDNLCEGGSLSSGTAGLGNYAESLYDIKPHSSPDKFNIAYHYALFGHYVGCDTPEHCNPPSSGGIGDCPAARNPDGTAKNITAQGQTGLAEIAGNDLVVSLGGAINDAGFLPHFVQPATFMHELGHNLGLRHDGHMDTQCKTGGCRPGDTCVDLSDGEGLVCHQITYGVIGREQPNYKPNYLSIMNYKYEANGIPIATGVGSSMRLSCTADAQCGGDGGMCVVGYCVRLDYSRQTLPTAGNTPGALSENNLNEPAGLGSGTADMFLYKNGVCPVPWSLAPTTGPLDWDGDGDFTNLSATADVDALAGTSACDANPIDSLSGSTDWPDLSGIPFQYNFQCRSTGGPMGDGVSVVRRVVATPIRFQVPAKP